MIPTLVIGIGNTDRGDDGAGIQVARRLRARGHQNALVRECEGSASCLLECWQGRARVILVDAASGAGRPGTVHRYEAHRQPLPTGLLRASTHSWGVAEAIEIARVLGQLPPQVVVYAIEGKTFGPGGDLSPRIQKAVERVGERILSELERTIECKP
jgi:hydrogenase maturation protease